MYTTREDYLNAFIEAARPHFERVNAPLPANVRVAVGFGRAVSRARGSANAGHRTPALTAISRFSLSRPLPTWRACATCLRTN